MIKIITELDKRGHRAQLTLNGSKGNDWVSLITVQEKDWSTIKMRSELGEDSDTRKLFNSLLYSLLRNGYKLKELK
jgi:hypothetical protein